MILLLPHLLLKNSTKMMNMRYATEYEYETLRQRALELARGYKELETDYEKLQSENETFRSRLDRNNQVIESYVADITEHEKIAESLQNENTGLREQLAEMTRKFEEQQRENEKVCAKFTEAYRASQDAIMHRDMLIKRANEQVVDLIDKNKLELGEGEIYNRVSKEEANAIYGGYYELP